MKNINPQSNASSNVSDQITLQKREVPEKQRGGCLTLYLIFSSFAMIPGLIGLYLLLISLPTFTTHLSRIDTILYNNFYLSIVGFILYGIGLIGAWKWMKWGIILMVTTGGLLATTDIIYSDQLVVPVYQSIISLLVISGILFIVIKDEWSKFH